MYWMKTCSFRPVSFLQMWFDKLLHYISSFVLLYSGNKDNFLRQWLKYIKSNMYNLGLRIASWGFGAEMMYSLNFGFWSSASFFSPDDVTSGFTGSGGFSLLWGPFVQPWGRGSLCVRPTNTERSGRYHHSKGGSQCRWKQQTMETWPQRTGGMDQNQK